MGLENGYAEPTDIKGEKFKLVRIRDWLFWICLIGLGVSLVWMLYLVNETDIVRDFTPKASDPKDKRFSLARCQMAFWFFLVIASFLFVWLITGAYDIITPSVLGLIGIASGTALAAAAIDVSKPKDIKSQINDIADSNTLITLCTIIPSPKQEYEERGRSVVELLSSQTTTQKLQFCPCSTSYHSYNACYHR
ncbi:hypothetical protein [Nostoc sp.]|uniref:hypothetical protein n=1 Tax=Nostoc sp. TaxID=1180 RepID=UPI002FF48172